MGRIKEFFNKSPTPTNTAIGLQMVTETGNGFYNWNGKIYKSDIVRSCIRPKVKAVGKLVGKHIRENRIEGFSVNPDVYMRFLLEEPNPYMTGQMLQEKLTTQLQLNNNAFAFIARDENGLAAEIYPIPAYGIEALYDKSGGLYLKCTLKNGKICTFSYNDIIHLKQDYNENDIFGESPMESLLPLMEIVNTTDQGIVKAIRNSGVIKWLLKFNTALRKEDIIENTKEFTDNFLSIDNTGGAAGIDSKADAKQVDPKDYVPNAAQMDRTVSRIHSFFNTNEKIIQSKFNEDEWNAYYESEIEPLAMQLSFEYTRKLFSRRERGFGNKIVFEASNLQYASMATKLNLVSMVDRGAMTPNEWRKILGGLAPIEGGDLVIRRLDTGVVSSPQNKRVTEFKNKVVNVSEKIYAVDFDGTLCKNIYPAIGYPIEEVIDYVKALKNEGNKVILYTCRVGDNLEAAVEWCAGQGIEFDAINENLQEIIDQFGGDCRKIYADYYVDDRAMNVSEIINGGGE